MIVAAAVGTTALVTAVIVSSAKPPAPAAPTGPHYSAAEQAAAKQAVCDAFDGGARGSTGQGGVVANGQLNVPVVLRALNTIVVVREKLSPAVPSEIAQVADRYLSTSSDLTTAAMSNAPIDKLIELTKNGNAAIDAFSDACGLPR